MGLQYFRPGGVHFVGDCMPFSHAGRFHLYYLIDENHHQGLGGLGGHQWAHASTTDLVHWEHHPLALAIEADWECSICTGSTFFHDGLYHAFYATRKRDWTQHLGHAISSDGVHFEKLQPNPFASAPEGYSPHDLRDPFVFRDESGRFQMLVTSKLAKFPLHNGGGCLLRYSSSDLTNWRVEGPFLVPAGESGYVCIPECPDYFRWNGWYYLIFGQGLKTCYRISREAWGPWIRPAVDTLGNAMLAVMKTAEFGQNRRIGAAWIGTRKDNRDSGGMQWGGQTVFRELVQMGDGRLGTRFVKEMMPDEGSAVSPTVQCLTKGASGSAQKARFDASQGQEVMALRGVPHNYHLRCKVKPTSGPWRLVLGLRGTGDYEAMYPLSICPHRRTVQLAGEQIDCVDGLESEFELEVILHDDIIDVCVDGERCLINRLPERRGDSVFFSVENGVVDIDDIEIQTLEKEPRR